MGSFYELTISRKQIACDFNGELVKGRRETCVGPVQKLHNLMGF